MSCENLLIPKPQTLQCPTNLFGIPYGAAGRIVAGINFPIDGIVLHCYDGTIAELCNEMKCRTRSSVISGSYENSFHYGIGAAPGSGGVQQFVEDANIAWTFGTYKNNTYVSVPPPNIAINWPVLQGVHGVNTTPDVYTINIALAIGRIVEVTQGGCFTCPTSSGLQQTQHDMLVQLLAFIAQEYQIPIDADHITFHDLIHCGEGQECVCTELDALLAEVGSFCPPCEQEAIIAPEAATDDDIQFIYGITEPCCPSSPGCAVKIPWNGCYIGDLAVDGDLSSYILGLSQDPVTMQWCLTRGCLALLSPLTGCGTVDDPLGLDLCAFGDWVPTEEPTDILEVLGIDDQGCLIKAPWCDMVVECETSITVENTDCIAMSASGVNNHTISATPVISPDAGNQLVCNANGLFVDTTCDDIMNIFNTQGDLTNIFGVDDSGGCVYISASDLIINEICSLQLAAGLPTQLLGRDNVDCPVFFSPSAIIEAGLVVQDTQTVDLTLAGNVLTADAIISPAVDNILINDGNGLYVPPSVVTTVVGSDCIDVMVVGSDYTVSLIVSPAIGGNNNVLQCTPTGAYVIRGADANVSGPIIGNGSDLNPLDIDFSLMDAQDLCDFGSVLPNGSLVNVLGVDGANCLRIQPGADVIANFLVANDTNCIDLTLTGNILTADPILAPAQAGVPNALTCLATGLYVPRGADLIFTDTNCIELTETNGVVTADPVIDVDPTNALECRPTGLYVSDAPNLIALDTDCINLDYNSGTGELQAFPTLAGSQGGVTNILSCITGQGLFVPESAGLQVLDTNCIDLTLISGVLSANPVLDPDPTNILLCNANGLYVPQTGNVSVADTDCIDLTLTGTVISADPILAGAQNRNSDLIPNALECLVGEGLYVPIIDRCEAGDIIQQQTPTTVSENNFVIIDGNGCLTRGDRLHNLNAPGIPTTENESDGYTIGSKWIVPIGTLPGQIRELEFIYNGSPFFPWQKVGGGTHVGTRGAPPDENIPAGVDFVPSLNVIEFDVLGEIDLATDSFTPVYPTNLITHVAAQMEFPVPAVGDLVVEMGFLVNGLTTFSPIIQRFHGFTGGETINLAGSTPIYTVSSGDIVEIFIRHNAGGDAILSSFVVNHGDPANSF